MIDLHGNAKLSGSIPASYGELPALTDFSAAGTGICGSIPGDLSLFVVLENQQQALGTSIGDACGLKSEQAPALYDLQNAVADPNSALLVEGWAFSADGAETPLSDPCTAPWGGISCQDDGGVTALSLLNLGLGGALPLTSSLGLLSDLLSLDLASNGIGGTLSPEALSGMSLLTALDMSGGSISGTLPSELWGLAGLQRLALSSNDIGGTLISGGLEQLAALTALALGGNLFSGGIPDDFGGTPELADLNLAGNRLTGGLPESMAYLQMLTSLELQGNLLSGGLPAALLANLTSLTYLDLSECLW